MTLGISNSSSGALSLAWYWVFPLEDHPRKKGLTLKALRPWAGRKAHDKVFAHYAQGPRCDPSTEKKTKQFLKTHSCPILFHSDFFFFIHNKAC
jgi:hypothetical protein